MSAKPFDFARRGCECCETGGSWSALVKSAQSGDDAVIDAMVRGTGVHAAGDSGDHGTSATAATGKSHAVEISSGSDDKTPIDVAAPRCEADAGHSEGRFRQVRLAGVAHHCCTMVRMWW